MSSKDDPIAALSQEGYRLLREGKLAEAEERFTRILLQQPENSYALVGMGDTARKGHTPGKAVEYYERCLRTDPENSFALFGLADTYRSQRRYAEAVDVWERYLAQDDTNVTVLTRVADGYRKLQNRDRSLALYHQVLEIEAENPYALIGIGHLHYDHREYQEALEYWSRMLTVSGARVDIRVLTSIGNCYRKLKRFDEGKPFFEQALEREPGNFYALFGLADCYRGLHDAERSLQCWQQILERDPENRIILTRAGDAYRTMGELDSAVESYERALSISEDLYARIGLAVVERLRGEPFEAISALEDLRERYPGNSRVAVELAQTYEQNDDREQAIAVLERFVARDATNDYANELLERYQSER
jgi:tetratricopeptide (TPR) repeat protein